MAVPAEQAPSVVRLYDTLVEPDRTYYPGPGEGDEPLLDRLSQVKEHGGHIAIVDGAYDVPHDQHTWYLRDVRRIAAEQHFGFDTNELVQSGHRAKAQQLVADPSIFLIVTLDADEKIARLKGGNPAKGGAPRPIYTWQQRANRLGGFVIPDGNRGLRPVLDLIVPEGDSQHQDTALESHLKFGQALSRWGVLDTWVVYGEHSATVEAASELHDGTVVTVPDGLVYVTDPRTGQAPHSSTIIRMIRGENVVPVS